MESVAPGSSQRIAEGVPQEAYFYFAHSYAALDAGEASVAYCDHCGSFVAVLEQDNIFATQFHPEKSGPVGAQILSNFVRQAGLPVRRAGGKG
jgi:imidazole glycerol-phosphate synthase subunit HisH